MKPRLYQVQVNCCMDCPAYRDRDRWCLFSDEPVHPDHDILLDIAEFCELKEDVDI